MDIFITRYGHIYYKIIPSFSQTVKGIPNIKEDHEGVCKGCALRKNTRKPFTSSDTRFILENMVLPSQDKGQSI